MRVLEIQPTFDHVVTTANEYKEVQYFAGTDIIDPNSTKTSLKEYQTVLFTSPTNTVVKPGDVVYTYSISKLTRLCQQIQGVRVYAERTEHPLASVGVL